MSGWICVAYGAAMLVYIVVRVVRAARQRVCPVCLGRDLTCTGAGIWHGPACGGSYQSYRCACGAELFEENGQPPMTHDQLRVWHETRVPLSEQLPRATASERGRARRP